MSERVSEEEVARLRAIAHAIENKQARQFSPDEYMWLLGVLPKLLAEREALLEQIKTATWDCKFALCASDFIGCRNGVKQALSSLGDPDHVDKR